MRTWCLRMSCTYEGDKNHIVSQMVEQRDDAGNWKPLEIGNRSPGFLIFVYSLLTCQHLYMFANAAEHGLELASTQGTLDLAATEGWMLADLVVDYTAQLRSGTPTAEAIEDIRGRMNQCPVSRNIHPSGAHVTRFAITA